MTLRVAVMLVIAAALGHACDCITAPAREARRESDIVFRGSVARFRYTEKGDTMVVFRVSRVWKGQVPAEFEMRALQADCLEFPPGSLKLGNDLLVYAHRVDGPDYFPLPCNTTLVQTAKDIQELGPGKKPKEK